MQHILSLISEVAQQLGANQGMNYFALLQLTLQLRSKQDPEIIPTPDAFLQYVLQNCTPDVLEQIFNSATTILQTFTIELDCEGRQMTFGKMMEAFRAQQSPSHDPEELPPTFGLPRIILTFEVWDIVVNLHSFHMQMPAVPYEHSIPNIDF